MDFVAWSIMNNVRAVTKKFGSTNYIFRSIKYESINSYPKKVAKIVFVVKTKPKNNNNRGVESNVNNYFFP